MRDSWNIFYLSISNKFGFIPFKIELGKGKKKSLPNPIFLNKFFFQNLIVRELSLKQCFVFQSDYNTTPKHNLALYVILEFFWSSFWLTTVYFPRLILGKSITLALLGSSNTTYLCFQNPISCDDGKYLNGV